MTLRSKQRVRILDVRSTTGGGSMFQCYWCRVWYPVGNVHYCTTGAINWKYWPRRAED